MRWRDYKDDPPAKDKGENLMLCYWVKDKVVLTTNRPWNFMDPPDYWCYVTTPAEDPRIETPADIYDHVFQSLDLRERGDRLRGTRDDRSFRRPGWSLSFSRNDERKAEEVLDDPLG